MGSLFFGLRAVVATTFGFCVLGSSAFAQTNSTYWIKLKASTKEERTHIVNSGASIESVADDYVIAIGNLKQVEAFKQEGLLDVYFEEDPATLDFPKQDLRFHTYDRVVAQLQAWAKQYPNIVRVASIGKSGQGRDLLDMTISEDPDHSSTKPGIVFMGGHHAREHVSVEMPMGLIEYILGHYQSGDADMVRWVKGREIHVIPMVNPDGLEYDIDSAKYHMWRKNRRDNKDGTYGVDLNRNYGYFWGTGGSSTDTDSEVYMGPSAFSEPETQVIKNFVDTHSNLSTLLTFHTFSQLILYPWGHTYDGIAVANDKAVYEKMAQTMAKWNNYTAEQASELYIASGDTTDWSYGVHKIISFTFELDPGSMFDGGFYPGQSMIDTVIQKNIKPCLYLLEYADNPYRVLNPSSEFGVNLSWIK